MPEMTEGTKSDCRITAALHGCAVNRQHFKEGRATLVVTDNTVTLQGEVGTYYGKQIAQERVRLVDGSKRIENNLSVRELARLLS